MIFFSLILADYLQDIQSELYRRYNRAGSHDRLFTLHLRGFDWAAVLPYYTIVIGIIKGKTLTFFKSLLSKGLRRRGLPPGP